MIELNRKTVFLLVAMPTTAVLLYWLIRSSRDEVEDQVQEKKSVVTSRQTTIEMAIPQKAVGAIIGRQGQNIKELQEKSGAKINFKDDDRTEDSNRTIIIRGTPEKAQSAECLIRKLIADLPVTVKEDITVPAHCLGRIIGRHGETIRQMSRASKCKIYIDRTQDDYRDRPRVVSISGPKEQIEVAKILIREKLEEEEAFRARTAVSAANREKRKGQGHQGQRKNLENNHNDKVSESGTSQQWEIGAAGDTAMSLSAIPWPKNKEFVEVYVSAVANPGTFWVQIISSMALQLDEMTAKMSREYSEGREQAPSVVKVGDFVAAPFENDTSWYRAKVMGVKGEELDLFFVDYGDSNFINRDKVRYLSSEYLQLPIQSIECRLANVKPKDEEWSDASTERFEELTNVCKWKVLMAKAVSYSESIPCLTLVDTNSETDVNINEEIVKQGFGEWDT